jgi:transcriptional regulator
MRRGSKAQKTDLRVFLAEHRALVTPAMAGLPAKGLPRRVPGLRRDEIARLLGVATDYYADLERGLLPAAPETSLQDLLSEVLALSPNDRQRLSLLLDAAYPNGGAVTPEQTPADPPEQQASEPDSQQDTEHSSHAPIRQLLDSFDMPAYMRTRSLDLVAVNRPGRLLYAPVLEWAGARKKTVNLLEFAFLDQDAAQNFWPDWGDVITRAVSDLRTALEAYPNDPDLIGVVGTLTARSRLFCRMWIDQDLPPHSSQGEEKIFHSLIGTVTVPFRMLAEDDGAQVVVFTPSAGSPAHAAMQRLRAWAAAG